MNPVAIPLGSNDADRLRVILIASVRPELTTAASLTLHRHLVNRPNIELITYLAELNDLAPGLRITRFLERLKKSRFSRFGSDLEYLAFDRLALHRRLSPPPKDGMRTVVLTLAYRNGWRVARDYAKKHGLPLVVRFDDWWPDMASLNSTLRAALNQRFFFLYKAADSNICVSEGMKSALGPHPRSYVVLPLTTENRPVVPNSPAVIPPLRVCYLGNMYDYGPMLAGLAECVTQQPEIRVEFRGAEPQWPATLKRRMKEKGLLHGFGVGPDFDRWFESFHVYLVAMFFDDHQRRRAETCFATKLVEYSALGRPVVIWAPEYSSAVQWARKSGAARCVTDPDPKKLVSMLINLAGDENKRKELGALARKAYETDFNPSSIQDRFIMALKSAVQGGRQAG